MTLLNTIVYHADSGQIYDKKLPYNTTDKFFLTKWEIKVLAKLTKIIYINKYENYKQS